jgi:hypothetical protein
MGNAYDSASLLVTPNGYKASKIYSAKPTDGTGDLAFSRASTAMRRNSAGLWESVASNVPRLQYPVGGGCPSWLFEPQATNVFLGSEFTENTNWFPVNCSKVLNSIQSPKEGFLATKVVEDTSNDVHINLQVAARASNATYTISFYAKTNGRNIGVFNNGAGDALNCSFDLTAGTGSGTGFVEIKDAGNGWWLCVCQYNPSVATFNIQLRLLNGTTASYLGDGVSGAYIWNTQYELGSAATSPIITAGSAVTRLADAVSKTGISSLIGQTEGTLFVDFVPSSNSGSNRFSISDNSSSNWIFIGTPEDGSNGGSRFFIRTDSSTHVDVGSASYFTIGQRYKLALAYKSGSWAVYGNGTLLFSGTDLIASVSLAFSQLNFFNVTGGSADATEQVNQVALFKTRLSNAELAELTTL